MSLHLHSASGWAFYTNISVPAQLYLQAHETYTSVNFYLILLTKNTCYSEQYEVSTHEYVSTNT